MFVSLQSLKMGSHTGHLGKDNKQVKKSMFQLAGKKEIMNLLPLIKIILEHVPAHLLTPVIQISLPRGSLSTPLPIPLKHARGFLLLVPLCGSAVATSPPPPHNSLLATTMAHNREQEGMLIAQNSTWLF